MYKLKATCFDKKGRVISTGYNRYNKSHPLQAFFANKVGHPYKIYLHAEIDALLRAKGRPVHSIHVERLNKAGLPLLAMPCPICQAALVAFGVSVITYTERLKV